MQYSATKIKMILKLKYRLSENLKQIGWFKFFKMKNTIFFNIAYILKLLTACTETAKPFHRKDIS